MPHLPPAHNETSKHDSPNKTEIKEKQNETIPDSNSNLAKSMTHHNQTKEITTWFLGLMFGCSAVLGMLISWCSTLMRSSVTGSGPGHQPQGKCFPAFAIRRGNA
jgi:hypothetical protein